jgi:hypothetical protein
VLHHKRIFMFYSIFQPLRLLSLRVPCGPVLGACPRRPTVQPFTLLPRCQTPSTHRHLSASAEPATNELPQMLQELLPTHCCGCGVELQTVNPDKQGCIPKLAHLPCAPAMLPALQIAPMW